MGDLPAESTLGQCGMYHLAERSLDQSGMYHLTESTLGQSGGVLPAAKYTGAGEYLLGFGKER